MKHANYLGNRTDKMHKKGQGIPHHIAMRFTQMQKYTAVVRAVFASQLPLANWDRCFVTNVEQGCVTISVDNYTFANQMRYMSHQYLQAFKSHSTLFADINTIKVIATNYKANKR